MSFPKIVITSDGKDAIANVLAGTHTITFTRFALGNGECDEEDWEDLEALAGHMLYANITQSEIEGTSVVLSGELSNSSVSTQFWWKELGIMAKLTDVEEETEGAEFLCFYGNSGNLAEFVPKSDSTTAVTHKWTTSMTISSTENVSALVQSITYATIEQFNAHKNNTENPHGVTKAQVGLSEVPNVSTNNQTPTFVEAVNLSEIQSGSTLSNILCKVAKAIKSLISHLANTNNPHSVTATQINAAPKYHANANTTYGVGTKNAYGHLKMNDDETVDDLIHSTLLGQAYAETYAKGYDSMGLAPTNYAIYALAKSMMSTAGSYTGTGSVNPNSIETDNIPRIIVIKASGNVNDFGILFVPLGFGLFYAGTSNEVTFEKRNIVSCTLTNNKYHTSWVSSFFTPQQLLNTSGTQYTYTVIY